MKSPKAAPRRGSERTTGARTWWTVLAAVVLASGVVVGVSIGGESTAAAAVPVVGDPGVLPPVNLDQLNPDPIRQWGVVGVGDSYTAAKSLVWDFAEIGSRIYVAGMFLNVQRNGDDKTSQPISQPYLAAFDRDSGAWISTFTPQFNRTVYALEVAPNGNLLVGGEFTMVNGEPRTGLVMLDPITGATVPSFLASISASTQPMVRDILRVGSKIYIAGQISGVQSGSASPFVWNAARLDANTGAYDTAWVPKFMGGIWQIAVDQSRGQVHAAGFFTSVDGQPNTARFATVTEATGAYIPGLAAYVPNEPNGQTDTVAVVYADNKIYVGGAQHTIQVLDPATHNRLGFENTGIKCNSFSPSCGYVGGGDFQTLEVIAGGMVMGGCHCYYPDSAYSSFSNTRTDNRFAIAYNTSDGYVASSFIPGLKQQSVGTYALFTDTRGCLYVGGDYTRQADGDWLGGFGRFCRTVQAPVGVSASSSNGGAKLTWQAPATSLPVAYYKVYKDGVFAGDTSGLTYGFSGLTVGAKVTFTVRTMDVAGRLSDAATASVTIAGPDTQAPTVPGAAAGTVDGSSVTLTWGASSDLPNPGGVGLSGYLIHRDWDFIKLVPAGTTSFTDTGVADGSHRYEVRAVDLANNISAPAAPVNVTVGTPDTQAPTVPGTAAGTVTGSSVTLTWGASSDLPNPGGVGLSGYLVHRDYNFVKFVPAGTTSFTDTSVPDGPHRYEVRSIDLGGRFSDPVVVNVSVGAPDTQPPTVPTSVGGTVSGSSVTLTWGASSDLPSPGGVGLSGYLVHRDWNFVKFVPAGTLSFTDTGVTSGSHRYEVRSVDLANNISAPAPPVIVSVP